MGQTMNQFWLAAQHDWGGKKGFFLALNGFALAGRSFFFTLQGFSSAFNRLGLISIFFQHRLGSAKWRSCSIAY